MNTLKEQNGKYYQQCKVVMLAADKGSKLHINNLNKMYFTAGNIISEVSYDKHIYILSDEEIKEGDWCFNISKNIIAQKDNTPMDIMWKKIIATTDTSLEIRLKNHNDFDSVFKLPQPSQSFIKKYIEEDNKGSVIENVLVEYDYYPQSGCEGLGGWIKELKIDSDNTITIKKIKDSWSREEVIALLNSYGNHVASEFFDCDCEGSEPFSMTEDEWIKENL